MNKHINPFKTIVLFALALVPLISIAGDGDNVEKKRTISKTYTVGADDRLSIDNTFGNVVVSTWDKNEIQVDIEIGVRAPSDEKAQRMMDEIMVSDNQGGKDINFITEIGNMGKGNKDNGNGNENENERKFYVDYKISMPSKNPLRIENSFGKVTIPDFTGSASITSKFGELTTGKISNAKLIHVEFGRADIGKLNNADLVLKFNSHSEVAGLAGSSKVDIQFCSHVDMTVDNSISDLVLYASYSTIFLKVSNSMSAQVDAYTNFGSFKNRTRNFKISADSDDENSGPKFDQNFSGSAGSGTAKIKIKSSFGTVRLMNTDDSSKDQDDNNDDKGGDKTNVNM
jgi:hypothetical protein